MICLKVLGVPIPLARPRARKIGSFVSIYDSQTQEKQQVTWQIRHEYSEKPLSFPLSVDILFALPIPKQTSKVRTRNMLEGIIVPSKRPDIDNLVKFILDCLNGILFDDDSQIIALSARKIYSNEPRTIIRATKYDKVYPIKDQEIPENEGDYRDC